MDASQWTPKHFIAVAILDFFESYLLVALLSFIRNRRVHKLLFVIFLFITFTEGLLRIPGIALAYRAFNEDIVAAVLGTNPVEASEMAGPFFSFKNICIFLGYPCAIAVTVYFTNKFRTWSPSKFCSEIFFPSFFLVEYL